VSAFTLKIIALVTMIIDHAGVVLFPQYFIFRVIGRVAFPLFVYLIAEGFRHTRNTNKFLIRLFAFAIISQPFYSWAIRGADFPSISFATFLSETNIFYTLFFGGLSIVLFKWLWNIGLKANDWHETPYLRRIEYLWQIIFMIFSIIPLFIAFWLAEVVFTSDYGYRGVAFIFIMYVVKTLKYRLIIMALICIEQHEWIIAYLIEGMHVPFIVVMMIPATLLPVLFVAFYNGERGPSWKWFFYASYPLHLAMLQGLSLVFKF